ncbi:sigma-70 family RNA polymerase sigma factor [Sphingobacterium spiritivorum]|uniref:sigma-70 family RNA polymerase sigma factor n=1 Tax=Sphingobacterium TaxID=28453 RepID=UPI001917F4AD|nr:MULTISPECIES: sigma-70 family RNA polymerase sigma factor [Sphingobacterium]QQT25098.1 sigma-70 family RNA polymerase sigma factor [Sphingobacterium spiritivorum]
MSADFTDQTSDFTTFESLYKAWNTRVYAYVLKKTGSTFVAEEVVQLVFIKIWKNSQYDLKHIKWEAQLFCITRSVMIDYMRQSARYSRNDSLWEGSPDYHYQTEVEDRENMERLRQEVDRMPPIRQTVFRLSRFEHQSYAQIAERLQISVRTVENHIASALKVLKKTLFFLLFFF